MKRSRNHKLRQPMAHALRERRQVERMKSALPTIADREDAIDAAADTLARSDVTDAGLSPERSSAAHAGARWARVCIDG